MTNLDDIIKFEVIDIVDQSDGSAIMHMNMSSKALEAFAKIGILHVLSSEAKRVISESQVN